MSRAAWTLCLVLFAGTAAAQQPKPAPPAPETQEAVPPEEEEGLQKKEYAFNPLQASKEVQIGKFYMKRGNYKGAAMRFEEASKWDPSRSDALQLLAEALEKQKKHKEAHAVYNRILQYFPNAPEVEQAKKKVENEQKKK